MSADGIHDREADEAKPGRGVEIGLAFGELASENAELYKRIDSLQSRLEMEQARHSAWSREVTRRDEALASRVDHLERKLAERLDASDAGMKERRIAGQEPLADEQKAGQEPSRRRVSTEFIAVGAAVGGVALTAVGDVIGTPTAGDITGIAGGVVAAAAAGLTWIRKHREEADADRRQD